MKQLLALFAALFLVAGFSQQAEAKICVKFKKICIKYSVPVVKKTCVSWKNQTKCAKFGPNRRCIKLVPAGRVCVKYVSVKGKRACVGGWKKKCIKW